jgi:hypothetical protein
MVKPLHVGETSNFMAKPPSLSKTSILSLYLVMVKPLHVGETFNFMAKPPSLSKNLYTYWLNLHLFTQPLYFVPKFLSHSKTFLFIYQAFTSS